MSAKQHLICETDFSSVSVQTRCPHCHNRELLLQFVHEEVLASFLPSPHRLPGCYCGWTSLPVLMCKVSKDPFFSSTVFKPIHCTEYTKVSFYNCPKTARLKRKCSWSWSQICCEDALRRLPLGLAGEHSAMRRPEWLGGILHFHKSSRLKVELSRS